MQNYGFRLLASIDVLNDRSAQLQAIPMDTARM